MAQICVAVDTFVEIDDTDWAEVMNASYSWHLSSWGYARYMLKNRQFVYLHQLIYSFIDPTYKGIVDHDDLNILNNCRYNLRPATSSENKINGSIRVDNKSGTPGVIWDEYVGKWKAYLNLNGKMIWTKRFPTLEEAIEARRKAALQYHQDFAKERFHEKD